MRPPPNLPTKRPKKRELAEWIERTRPQRIGEVEWEKLRDLLAPISESYLRRLLRDSGVPLAPLVEGVRQESFEALEASLIALWEEYETGDAARRAAVRGLVITAKDHARLAARKDGSHEEKEEMILWMLTWLENPPLFPQWVRLRRAALAKDKPGEAR
jgi:hypothetical protein